MGIGLAAAAGECFQRLQGAGIDVGAFNTTENAADFADLRKALGIAEWNVYGVSYGTDLALTYMRDHPDGIRSVALDSVVPPPLAGLGINWSNSREGLDNIFAACAAEPACSRRYPDPRGAFVAIVQRLENAPLEMRVAPVLVPGEKPPPDAATMRTVVDGGAIANYFTGISEILGPRIPEPLDDLQRGDVGEVVASVAAVGGAHSGDLSWGLHNGVVCSEWVPYETADRVLADGRPAYPEFPDSVLRHPPQFAFMAELCRQWPVLAAPAAQRAVTRSSIPTLVVAGSYDAITAHSAARAAARSLQNSTLIVIPGAGHFTVPKSACAIKVMNAFLADPTRKPDAACLAGLDPRPFVVD